MNDETSMIDVIIIGAGPIGLACGIEAKKAGLTYTIIDKGCLVNSIYRYPLNMTFFSTSDRLEIGDVPFISHGNKPNRFEALEYYRRVATNWELDLKLYEEVVSISGTKGEFSVMTSRDTYPCRAVVLATGFYDFPYMMDIPGEELSKVRHYYDEPHPYFDQKVVVIGAANSAVDVALETYRKGADVTMVVREEALLPTVKYWVKPDIENRIKEGAIKAYFESEVKYIREHEVDIVTPDGSLTLENDFVLAMTGYKPNFAFMEMIGVKIGDDDMRTPGYDEETNETNVENVYLAGVVCGGLRTNKWFIENSRDHAPRIMKHLKKKLKS